MLYTTDILPCGSVWFPVSIACVAIIACACYWLVPGQQDPPQEGVASRSTSPRDQSSSSSPKTADYISLDSMPKLSEMLSLKCGDETKTIIQDIAVECNVIGILLELPLSLVKNEWEVPGASYEQKCQKIIEQWLMGRGDTVQWKKVIEVLHKRRLGLADDLETCIQ